MKIEEIKKEYITSKKLFNFRELLHQNTKEYFKLKKWLDKQELDIEFILYEDECGNEVLKEYLKQLKGGKRKWKKIS